MSTFEERWGGSYLNRGATNLDRHNDTTTELNLMRARADKAVSEGWQDFDAEQRVIMLTDEARALESAAGGRIELQRQADAAAATGRLRATEALLRAAEDRVIALEREATRPPSAINTPAVTSAWRTAR